MSQLRKPSLGPIVGHTTPHSCKIWIRAGDPDDTGAELAQNRRTLAVIAIYDKQGKLLKDGNNSAIHYFRLHREQDRSGTFEIGVDDGIGKSKAIALKPDQQYFATVGTLTLDDPLPNDESIDSKALKEYLPKVKVWEEQLAGYLGGDSCATFTTFPRTNRQNKTTDHISFVVGSCRYPGLGWRTKNSDVIFKPILNHAVAETDKINFVLMVGDQIYADKASRFIPVGKADTNAEFQERYHNAFGSPNMRKLLRNVPHYMILDDHEIEDNWIQDRINKDKDKRELFQMAFFYYMVYQSMHAPKNFGDRPYYSFDCGGYPFFVLDTRTQRTMSVDADALGRYSLTQPTDTGRGRCLAGHQPRSDDKRALEWRGR